MTDKEEIKDSVAETFRI